MASPLTKLTKKNRWSIDFSSRSRTERAELQSPPGYNLSVGVQQTESTRQANSSLVIKKSWDLALGPLKQVPMNLFIMYMAGNTISIFPIMMIGMLFVRPIKALLSVQATFKMIEGSHGAIQKLVYLLGNVANILLALYKCQSMGLLPTHSSDWLAFVPPQERMEFAGGGIVYS